MAIEVAGLLALVFIFVLFVTQIIFPIATGNNLFPLFRRKLSAVDREMAHVKEELDLAEAKRKLELLKKSIPEPMRGRRSVEEMATHLEEVRRNSVVKEMNTPRMRPPVVEKEEKNESETDRS